MPNTFTLIASSTVGSSGASSIDFTSIPSTYTDLVVKLSLRSSTTQVAFGIRFNSNSSSVYSFRRLWGNGGSAQSSSGSSTTMDNILGITSSAYTASTFSNTEIYVPNYASSNNKSVSIDAVEETNDVTTYAMLYAGLFADTTAISSVNILPTTGNFAQYSTAYLYGVIKS